MSDSSNARFAAVLGTTRGRTLPWPAPGITTPPPSQCVPFKSFADLRRRIATGAVVTVDWLLEDGRTGRRDEACRVTGRSGAGGGAFLFDGAAASGDDGFWRGVPLPALARNADRQPDSPTATWELAERHPLHAVTSAMTSADREELATSAAAVKVRVTLLEEPDSHWERDDQPSPRRAPKGMTAKTEQRVVDGLSKWVSYHGGWSYKYRATGDLTEPYFVWTSQRDSRGRYLSFTVVPGSGKRPEELFKLDRKSISGHRTRKEAGAQAAQLQAEWVSRHGGK